MARIGLTTASLTLALATMASQPPTANAGQIPICPNHGTVTTQNGDFNADSNYQMVSSCVVEVNGTFTNRAGAAMYNSQGSSILLEAGAVLQNQGLISSMSRIEGTGSGVTERQIINTGTIRYSRLYLSSLTRGENRGLILNNQNSLIITSSDDQFVNANGGVINYIVSGLTNRMTHSYTMAAGGTVNIQGDTRLLSSVTQINSGTFVNQAGTISHQWSHFFPNGEVFSVEGTLDNRAVFNNIGDIRISGAVINSGTLTNDGDITNSGTVTTHSGGLIDNNSTFTNNSGRDLIAENGGTIRNDGTLDNAGTTTVRSGSTLDNNAALNNTGDLVAEGSSTIRNDGTFDNAGTTTVRSGSTLDNNTTLNSTGDLVAEGSSTIRNDGTFDNAGTTTVRSGSTLDNNTTLNNTGDLVAEGSSTIRNDGTFDSAGTTTIQATATLDNNGALNNTGDLNLNGGSAFDNTGGTLNNNAGGSINIATAVTLNGTVNLNAGGTVTVESGGSVTTAGSEANDGTINVEDGGEATLNSFFNNRGSLDNDGTTTATAFLQNSAGAEINNAGTLIIDPSQGGQSQAFFDNNGTLTNAAGGTIDIRADGSLTNFAGASFSNAGTIRNWGDLFQFDQGTSLGGSIENQGTLHGGSGTTLTGDVWGAGNYTGNVTMGGTFGPGNSPALVTAETLAFTSASALMMEIGGLTRGSEYDAIDALSVTLDGLLNVALLDLGDSFSPIAGDTFDLIVADQIFGTFSSFEFAVLSTGLSWATNLFTNQFGQMVYQLVVQAAETSVPTPGALILFAFGLLGLALGRQRSA